MPVAYVITEECVACGTCSEECPAEAIEEGEPYVINEEKCCLLYTSPSPRD